MRNLDKALWRLLQQEKLTNGDFPETELDLSPWYIKTMQGFAGWFAALFLLAFVGSIFGWLFRYNNQILLTISGLFCCIAAYLIFRTQKTPFLEQLALATSMCGQFMVAWGVIDVFSIRETTAFLTLALFQAVLALVMPNFLHRVISSWFAMVALFWGLNQQGIFGLDSAFAAAIFTVIWIKEQHWYKYHSILIPISFGLAISLLQFSGHLLFRHELTSYLLGGETSLLQQYSPLVGSVILALSCLYLVIAILSELDVNVFSRAGGIAIVGAILLLGLSFQISGVSSALLILLIGFFRQRLILIALGILSLISFISWYYYNLSETLLAKSIDLLSIGIALLMIAWVFHLLTQKAKEQHSTQKSGLQISPRQWLLLATVLVVLASINFNIYQKESLISNGQTVLLELAPVDPRSLIQGDYMRLNYKISRQLYNEALTASSEVTNNRSETINNRSNDGFVLVQLDQNNVATFVALSLGTKHSPQQQLLRYRIRDGVLKFATNAFFFQERTADIYQQAKYGEFKVNNKGDMLLVALRDDSYALLGKNSP